MSIKAPSKHSKASQSAGAKNAPGSPAGKGSIKNPKLRVRFDAVIAQGKQLNNAIGTNVDEIEAALRRLRRYRYQQEPNGSRPAQSQKPKKKPANSMPVAPDQVPASIPSISARRPLRVQQPMALPAQTAAAQAGAPTLTRTPLAPPHGMESGLQHLPGELAQRNAAREEHELPAAPAISELDTMRPKVGIEALAIAVDPPTIPALLDREEPPTEKKSDLLSAAQALLAALQEANKKLDQVGSPGFAGASADSLENPER